MAIIDSCYAHALAGIAIRIIGLLEDNKRELTYFGSLNHRATNSKIRIDKP